jgi:hypothetical protein
MITWQIVLGKPGLHQLSTKKVEIEAMTGVEAEQIAEEQYKHGWKVLTGLTKKLRGSYEA